MSGRNNPRAGSGKVRNQPYLLPNKSEEQNLSRKKKKAARKFVKWYYCDKEYNSDRPWPVPSSGAW